MAEWNNKALLDEYDDSCDEFLENVISHLTEKTIEGATLRFKVLSSVNSFWADHSWLIGSTESPIEKLFAEALVLMGEYRCFFMDYDFKRWIKGDASSLKFRRFYCIPQFEVENYRVDFFIVYLKGDTENHLVVECDGHEFHERTKEQAENDRSRDRFFTSKSIPVFRFTGAEIFRNPFICANQIIDFMRNE